MFNRNLRRRPLVAATVAFVSLCATACSPNVARLTLINKSRDEITSCVVKLNNDTANFGSLAVGGRALRNLKVRTDGSYDLTVQFANGKRLHQEIGYVTNGLNFSDTLEIYDDRAELIAEKITR
jgi:hypothetical protein